MPNLSQKGLKIVDRARLAKGFKKQSPELAQLARVSVPTVKRFLGRKSISEDCFKTLCQALDVDILSVVEDESVSSSEYIVTIIASGFTWENQTPIKIFESLRKYLENQKFLVISNEFNLEPASIDFHGSGRLNHQEQRLIKARLDDLTVFLDEPFIRFEPSM